MRLALRTANFCMERNAGAEKEDGKCSQLEDGKVLPAPPTFPISKVRSEFKVLARARSAWPAQPPLALRC